MEITTDNNSGKGCIGKRCEDISVDFLHDVDNMVNASFIGEAFYPMDIVKPCSHCMERIGDEFISM
eukprot:422515-Ditylum_brightwellii.AAC.1